MTRETHNLATVAASMHLIDELEEQSNLQTRLDDADRRATEAEMTAQESQAALARALLDGARIAADAAARTNAESEATTKAFRPDFKAVTRTASGRKPLPGAGAGRFVPVRAPHRSIVVHNDGKPYGIGLTDWGLIADRIMDRITDPSDDESGMERDRPPVRGARTPFGTVLLGTLLAVSIVCYSLTLFSLTRYASPAVTAMASSIFGMAPTDMLLEGEVASTARLDSGAGGGE